MLKITRQTVESFLHQTELEITNKRIPYTTNHNSVRLLYNVNKGYIVRFITFEVVTDFTTTNLEVAINKFNSYLD